MRFDEDKFYPPSDPALRVIAPQSTLAHWRCARKGPAFHKFGNRVLYPGKELNAFMDRSLIRTEADAFA